MWIINEIAIKKFSHIVRIFVVSIIGLYLGLLCISNMPAFNRYLSNTLSKALSEKIDSKVFIGNVKIGLFNRVDLSDVAILDQHNQPLIAANHIGACIEFLPILRHRIVVKDLRLFDSHLNCYKTTKDAKANYQFLIDSLSSKKPESKSKLDFSIKSLIVHNLNLKYNILSEAQTLGLFNPNHLVVTGLDGNIRLNSITRDSLNIRVRNLQLSEQSGFHLNKLAFQLIASKSVFNLLSFKMLLPQSQITLNRIAGRKLLNSRKPSWMIDMRNVVDEADISGKLSPTDFACFYRPLAHIMRPLSFRCLMTSRRNKMLCADISVNDDRKDFELQTKVMLDADFLFKKQVNLACDISQLTINSSFINDFQTMMPRVKLPSLVSRLDIINHRGVVRVQGKNMDIFGNTLTNYGDLREHVSWIGNDIEGKIEALDFNLGALLSKEKELGHLSARLSVHANLNKPLSAAYEGTVSNIAFHNYTYRNILISGKYASSVLQNRMQILDRNANLDAEAQLKTSGGPLPLSAMIHVKRLNLKALHLSDKYGSSDISSTIKADVADLSNPFSNSSLGVYKFKMEDPATQQTYSFDSLSAKSLFHNNIQSVKVNSDLLEARLNGNLQLKEIPSLFLSLLRTRLPIIDHYVSVGTLPSNKVFNFDILIKKSPFLEHVLPLPLRIEDNANVSGYCNWDKKQLDITAFLPSFTISGNKYKNGSLYLTNQKDSLKLLAQVNKYFNDTDVKLVVDASADNNAIKSRLEWKSLNTNGTKGSINSLTNFVTDNERVDNAHILIHPSLFFINDSAWNIRPSSIVVNKNAVQIKDFRISRDKKFIAINSKEGNRTEDKGVIATLNAIELEYVFDLLNFHPVYFGGKASGMIVTNDLSKNRDINATLTVHDFTFNHGEMGTLHLLGKWDNTKKDLRLDAMTQRTPKDSTLINGNVYIGEDKIDLRFTSEKTNMAFLNEYLSGIFSDLEGTASGKMRLFGPLGAMNLEGDEKVDQLKFRPKVLNVTYNISNDSLHIRPNHFIFRNVKFKDMEGNEGEVNGMVTHRTLHDFKYDFNFDAHNLLSYDWKAKETDTFWGTVYATGNVHFWGTPDKVQADVNITPNKKTVFVYDSSNSKASDNKDYIFFVNGKDENKNTSSDTPDKDKPKKSRKDNSTDTYLNLNINTNPDATLTILTDSKSGDNMSLNGSGPLQLSYYNKGKFLMYGTYTVDHGLYKVTIKDIIHKNFQMQKGGTIRFNGSPMDGDLNLKGNYTVNSVSLSDLNLGTNVSNNTANVDCILFFKGKCNAPEVSFDLDFPNVDDNQKQMVRNMISSEEDMNMQIIYLLSFGRFYTYDYATFNTGSKQDQSTVAMKSLLANTLSGQLNSMLSNAFHLNNWTFGTNLATGRIGWKDMEVEGLLSGSLLNNRLLINGNFGYRDQTTYSNNFVGDFNIRWLLTKSGVISLKAYSETNDRYFTKSSLTTQGGGILFQRDFNSIYELFGLKKKKKK